MDLSLCSFFLLQYYRNAALTVHSWTSKLVSALWLGYNILVAIAKQATHHMYMVLWLQDVANGKTRQQIACLLYSLFLKLLKVNTLSFRESFNHARQFFCAFKIYNKICSMYLAAVVKIFKNIRIHYGMRGQIHNSALLN